MDNAITTASPTALVTLPVQPAATGFVQRWQSMPARMQWMAVAGLVGLAAVVALMFGSARDADYRVLFPNLSEKDGGQVIEKLTLLNVPYRFLDGGGAIMVPAGRVHELRMKLAAAGLPSGASGGGYELLDKNSFGQTQGQERMKMQRAIEGELTTTIQALESVKSARVHLALPNQNGFFREQQKPTASVMLTLYPGRTLERAQIAGIVHLVSSSVPEMNPKAVSVLDQTGALLTASAENPQAGLDAQQLQYVNQVEAGYQKRIFELLEPLVGRDNLRATVTADVDFSQTEATAEEFAPNQGDKASIAIRSQQVSESSGSNGAAPSGVPGAASNQPPVPATAPVTGTPQPLQAAQGGGANANTRRDAVTNYEVDKTVRVTRNATGTVKRLNAAVVVNHRSVTDAKGKTTTTPLSAEEVEKLTALVRESIGFKQDRGDSVKVINAPFKVDPSAKIDPLPLWKQPEVIDMLRAAAVPAGLALVALIVFFGMIRPAMKAALAPPPPPAPGAQLNAVVDDDNALPEGQVPALPAPKTNEHLDAARALAKENPAAVANIVRGWVSGEAA